MRGMSIVKGEKKHGFHDIKINNRISKSALIIITRRLITIDAIKIEILPCGSAVKSILFFLSAIFHSHIQALT